MPQVPRRLAKLTRPRLMRALNRERLFAWLDEAHATRNAILVAGPPGAGKTTLVASWLDARHLHGLWVRVDAGDADPATFFHYLGEASRQFVRNVHWSLPALTPEYRSDVSGFARRFFRELFSRLPDRATLVLDNLQDIGSDSPLPAMIAEAVAEVPESITLIIVSREELPDCFARALGGELIACLDPDRLRLTLEEAQAVAAPRVAHPGTDVKALFQRSGGWAAGLTLLLEGVDAETGSVGAGTVPAVERVFAFLADQVIDGMAPEEQTFLMATAFLPHTTSAMAESLTGNPRAGAILQSLFRRHLFLHRTDGTERSFYYHALFRDCLRQRAENVLPPASLHELKVRAGSVCSAHGLTDEAIALLLDARAWPEAIESIESAMHDLLDQGRISQLRRWIDRVPESTRRVSAGLQYGLGLLMASDDPNTAIATLEAACELYSSARDRLGQSRTACALIEVIFYSTSDHRAMLPWIELLANLLATPTIDRDADLELRSFAALLLGQLFANPRDPDLAQYAQRTLERLTSRATPERKLMATVYLTIYATFTGHFELGPSLCFHGDTLAGDAGVTKYSRSHWLLWKAYLCRLVGRFGEGVEATLQADEIASQEGFRQVRFLAAYFRSGLEAAHGHPESAEQCATLAAQFVDPSKRLQVALLNACGGWLALYRDDAAGARAHGARAMEVARTLAAPSYRIHYGTPLVFGLAQNGPLPEAEAVLREQWDAITGTALGCFAPLLMTVEARIAERRGDVQHARTLIARMWQEAARHDHGHFLSWLKPWMSRYADWGLRDGVETTFIRSFVNTYGLHPEAGCSDAWPWPVRIYTLGAFEVFVNDTPLVFGRKTPKRPLELLQSMIAHGASGVAEHALVDHLWPDEEADAGHKAFGAALHRLRVLLGHADAIDHKGGRLALNARVVWTDAFAFDATVDSCQSSRPGDEGFDAGTLRSRALYRGAFLPDDRGDSWILSTRERLRDRFVQLVDSAGRFFEDAGRYDDAAAWYERGIEVDGLAEGFYQGLMRSRMRQGAAPEAIRVYRRLHRTLSRAFGRAPSATSEALYFSLLASQST